jgi:hypothetical protein
MADKEGDIFDVFTMQDAAGKKAAASGKTSAPAPAPEAGGSVFDQFGTSSERPVPTVGLGEDIGRTALAKGARGVAAIPGLPGDIASLTGTPNRYLPTTQDIINKAGSLHPSVKEALDYQPVHDVSRYIGNVAEFAPSALIPVGGVGLGARLAGAAGAGLATQGVEDYMKDKPEKGTGYELAAKLGAGLAGGLSAQKATQAIGGLGRGVITPQAEAARQLASTISRDAVIGGPSGAKAGVAEAIEAGIAPGAAGGRGTQELIQKAGARARPEAQQAYNDAISEFQRTSVPNIQNTMESLMGRPVKLFDEQQQMSNRIREVNADNYTRVMGLPQAQNIPTRNLQDVIVRLPKGTMDQVFDNLRQEYGTNLNNFGLIRTTKGWAIPPQGASLKFWDEVKQQLDSAIGSNMDPLTKSVKPGAAKEVARLTSTKKALIDRLDNMVDDYRQIRFEGSQLYGARDAMEAGSKFFNDTKKYDAIKARIAKLPEPQKEDFAYGYAAAFREMLDKNPSAALNFYRGKTAGFNIDKMRYALGEERANKLLGQVTAEYLNSSMKALSGKEASSVPGLLGAGVGGAGATALGEAAIMGENLLQGLSMMGSTSALIGALGATAGKAALNWKERRIGEEILRLAATPEGWERVGKLVQDDPNARSFVMKAMRGMSKSAPSVESTVSNQPTQEQASGGRIARASGGRLNGMMTVDDLMAAAERAKKQHGKNTEPLLDEPDEHITRALEVAKRHL